MITMENTRELIDFEYYGKSYRMAPEEIEAAYRYQEMQYRKADALRMLTSYAFGTRTSALQTGRLSSQQRQSKSPERGSFSGRAERENCLRTRSKPAPDGACISMP